MNTPRLLASLFSVLLVTGCGSEPSESPARNSGLDVLAQGADGYEQATPGRTLSFPADHGAHPDYRIEWWYLTANLRDASGLSYGAQWTLFRLAVLPTGNDVISSNNQVYMAHMAITTPDDHVSFQRYSRGGETEDISRAGVTTDPFFAWLDDWSLHSTGNAWLPLEVKARQGEYAFGMRLESKLPLILQGDAGFSAKHADGGGSYYYSQPFLKASGELIVAGQKIPVSGDAWLDREWSSQFLQDSQTGWDWFSLHLDSGEKLMLFQVRRKPGQGGENFLQGKLMTPDGSSTDLNTASIELVPLHNTLVAGRNLPLNWRVSLPQVNREFEIEALVQDQWMDVDFPYWEGAVIVSGDGPGNSGVGYMELTGYPAKNPDRH